jgi:uncharacterized Rossmann fold enzyme
VKVNVTLAGGGDSAGLSDLLPVRVNVSDDCFYGNIKSAIASNMPWLQMQEPHDGQAVIVGGGPSLKNTVEDIRWRKGLGHTVFALNATGKWLINRGIYPDAQILLDARWTTAGFIVPYAVKNYIASQCHPDVFAAAQHQEVILWHPNVAGISDLIGDRETALIGGGTTVGLQAMSIAYALGYRVLHLHGFDSCFSGMVHHAYAQPENDDDEPLRVDYDGREFLCARWMLHQADGFVSTARQLTDLGCIITVAGDGLIPAIAKNL